VIRNDEDGEKKIVNKDGGLDDFNVIHEGEGNLNSLNKGLLQDMKHNP